MTRAVMTRLLCLAAFGVLAVPLHGQTPEVEPNDSPATATKVELGATAVGELSRIDPTHFNPDWWTFDATVGDTLRFEWDAAFGGAWVRLYAADGKTVLFEPRSDRLISYNITKPGTYFLFVFVGGDTYYGARAGGKYYEIGLYTTRHPKPPCAIANDREPNDGFDAAQVIALGTRVDGILCPSEDVDYYRFHATRRMRVQIRIDRDTGSKPSSWGNPLLFESSPERTDEHWKGVWARGSVFEFWTPKDGDYYARVGTTGGSNIPYSLTIQATGPVPTGPGDPVRPLLTDLGAARAFAVGPNGDLFVGEEDQSIWRVSLTGEKRRWLSLPVAFYPNSMAFDASGNLLVVSWPAVYRVSPTGESAQLIKSTHTWGDFASIAVAPDGTIWIATIFNQLRHYGREGQLLDSSNVGGANPTNPSGLQGIAFSPDGILYFAAGDGIYRLVAGEPELFVRDTSEADLPEGGGPIGGFVFDVNGNLYVPHRFSGGVSVYDRTGAEIAKPFAWISGEARALAFGRNPDGSSNSCLFVLTNAAFTQPAAPSLATASILQLTPSAVSAPGCPVSPVDPPVIAVDDAVAELLHPGRLSAEQLATLDQRGNNNGRYDIGDLRAFLITNGLVAAARALRP